MCRRLHHEHLDARERVLVGREVSRYRGSGVNRVALEDRLVVLGYDRESVERYVHLVVSTDETIAQSFEPTPMAWFERKSPGMRPAGR